MSVFVMWMVEYGVSDEHKYTQRRLQAALRFTYVWVDL